MVYKSLGPALRQSWIQTHCASLAATILALVVLTFARMTLVSLPLAVALPAPQTFEFIRSKTHFFWSAVL